MSNNKEKNEPLYQIVTKRDEDLIKAYITFIYRVNYPNVTRNFLIVGVSSLVFLIASKFLWLRIIFLVIGLFCILMGLFRHRIPMHVAKTKDADYINGVVNRYDFCKDGVRLYRDEEPVSDVRKYRSIANFYDDEAFYYINFDDGDLIVLPKVKFTAGDPESFGAFITERSGQECQWTPATFKNKRIQRDNRKQEQMRRAREQKK